ncbi:MAG: hypothetical protein J0M00_02460 [Burkholderiales bacterium]|nr:hypothetical protein [Burkholderiales bacterium]
MNHFLRSTLSLAVALGACAVVTSPRAHGDAPVGAFNLHKLLAEVRKATAPFNDVNTAIAANYVKFPDLTGDCVAQPGQGGMGIHYLNSALVDAELDPLRPELLVYHQGIGGSLELAALEYVVPQPVWDALHAQPPSLFGHPFHLLRVPNRYGLATPLYTLHVWAWEHNADGLFNDWNRRVNCQ